MGTRSCVAIVDKGRILMVRQRYKGERLWTLPGGSIEEGETAAEAAKREALEETGLTVELGELVAERYSERIKGMYYCFLAKSAAGEPALGTDPELEAGRQELEKLGWFRLEELLEHQEISPIIERLR
ncbi:NUDIX domain-containing protein [Paenibacillus sp. GCM10012303]|jgi:8-oxo-dGTP diphosphatase|uniref:NUDIX domain-containing protein n=1 Tax=Paenibacillus sp. GCM10012303 TaxID=3317340 RepID=UPI003611614C